MDGHAGLPPDAATVVAGLACGSRGFTVRCTPRRRTVMASGQGGVVLFGKVRDGRLRDARAEWHWLHVLPMLGLRVPPPVALERRGRRSILCTAAVAGRPLDAMLREAIRAGDLAAAVAFACKVVAPALRRLHDQGLVFRDLYWNHLFAPSLAVDAEVVLLDVERVFRPRWRRRRWRIKDLAGLWASLPASVPPAAAMRFLRAYRGAQEVDRRTRRRFARAVLRKAARIAAHVPRHG